MQAVGPFDAGRRVVAAVSGGADSMALAWLLARWGDPLAAIVDHGLRAESADEAALTATRLATFGVRSIIQPAGLATGPAQATRARNARYSLLLQTCQETGRPDLVVAHHAGDQAETARMRQDAGTGPLGLAGMATIDYRPQARLLRPLLAIDPARLRATLRHAGIAWVEDPSNLDRRSPRIRLRAAMTPQDRAESLSAAAAAGSRRMALEREIAAKLAASWIAPEGFAIVPNAIDGHALSALIWTISGQPHPPPRSARQGPTARTLHGVTLRPAGRLGPGLLIAREVSAVAAPVPARDGLVWDGRFRLAGQIPAGLTLGALGADSALLRRWSTLPAIVLASLPALRRNGVLWAVPHLAFPDVDTCRSVRVLFWPARPIVPSAMFCGAVNPSFFRGV